MFLAGILFLFFPPFASVF